MSPTPSECASSPQPHWVWAAFIGSIVVITISICYALPTRDSDIWFHLLYGEYFWQHKTLIADHTLFSWTPSTNEHIYCTWLPDLFFYLIYNISGLPALFFFRYFCISLLVVGCYLFARKLKIATNPITWLIALLAVLMSYWGVIEKPEIFSFLFMSLLCWNWWYIRAEGNAAWKNCYLMPLIMLVWVNSHGGFVFGVVFLVCIASGELLNAWTGNANSLPSKTRKHLATALILSFFSLYLTPYGSQYLYQLSRSLLPTQENMSFITPILAYKSPFNPQDLDAFGLVRNAYISLIILIFLFFKNYRKIEWSALLANLVFAFLYTRFYRTTFFWPPIFLFSSLSLMGHSPQISLSRKRWVSLLLLPMIAVVISVWIAGHSVYKAAFYPDPTTWLGFGIGDMNPVEEAEYIKKNYPTARIGNTYNVGSYLLWKLWPENKIFIDARHFPYREWFLEYQEIFRTSLVAKKPAMAADFLRKYPCDIWCLEHTNYVMRYWFYFSPDWKLAFYGKNASVFVHKDIPIPKSIKRFGAVLNTLKNFNTAFDLLEWAFRIQDWEAVDEILHHMHSYFFHPEQKQILQQFELTIQQAKKDLNLL